MKAAKILAFLFGLLTALAPAAHAQFGSGIVYDPTQSAHAIQQLSQGEQELQHWATELQNWEQHLQKEEQIYTTAYQTMNQVIAAYNLAYQMSRMPQNLAARYKSDFAQWTNLTNPSFTAANTSGITSAWLNALNIGNPTSAASAYGGASIQLQSYPSSRLSALDATTQATVQNQYASSEIGQVNVTNLLSTLGTIRSDSAGVPAEAGQPRIGHLFDRSRPTDRSRRAGQDQLRHTAPDPLAAGRQPDPRRRRCSSRLSTQKTAARRAATAPSTSAIYFQQNFLNTMQNVTNGVSDSMHSISLSINGSN